MADRTMDIPLLLSGRTLFRPTNIRRILIKEVDIGTGDFLGQKKSIKINFSNLLEKKFFVLLKSAKGPSLVMVRISIPSCFCCLPLQFAREVFILGAGRARPIQIYVRLSNPASALATKLDALFL